MIDDRPSSQVHEWEPRVTRGIPGRLRHFGRAADSGAVVSPAVLSLAREEAR
jgi:hypothetical protein